MWIFRYSDRQSDVYANTWYCSKPCLWVGGTLLQFLNQIVLPIRLRNVHTKADIDNLMVLEFFFTAVGTVPLKSTGVGNQCRCWSEQSGLGKKCNTTYRILRFLKHVNSHSGYNEHFPQYQQCSYCPWCLSHYDHIWYYRAICVLHLCT